jgi:hypothetical protein
VSFRLICDYLSPEEISSRVGLAATYTRAKGEVSGMTPSTTNVWEFEIEYEGREALSEVIRRTLQALEPARGRILELDDDVERVVWCAIFSKTPETTISLDADVLAAVAEYEAEFICSVYSTT